MDLVGRLYNDKIIVGYLMKDMSHNSWLYRYAMTGKKKYLLQLFRKSIFAIVVSDLHGNDDLIFKYSADTLMEIKNQTTFSGISLETIRKYVLKKQLMHDENFENLCTYKSFCDEVNHLIQRDKWFSEIMQKDRKNYKMLRTFKAIKFSRRINEVLSVHIDGTTFWYSYSYNIDDTEYRVDSSRYDMKAMNIKQYQEFKGYLAEKRLVDLDL